MAGGNPAEMLSKRNFEKYRGKWVAAYGWHRINQIITAAKSLEEIQKKMAGRCHFNAIIFFVEDERAPV